jgi:hypothetical protein
MTYVGLEPPEDDPIVAVPPIRVEPVAIGN